jgi:metallo-beta-lactamase family protein
VDSPLAAKFNDTYRLLESYWDEESHQRLRQGRHPLSFAELVTVDDHQSHMQMVQQVAKDRIPTVVVAASGMCAGGRMVNYLKALLGDKRTDVLFVGYQAAGTPGRDILEYGPKGGYVFLDGQRIEIKAKISELSGYSAHAGQDDLINFVKRIRVKPKEIRLVHGDQRAKETLRELLSTALPNCKVWVP